MLSDPWLPLTDNIRMVPVAHSLMAYALEVRRALTTWQPDCIAVELPRPLRSEIFALVDELPVISLLAYKTPAGQPLMIPADPCDALIEAVRFGREQMRPIEFIDVVEAGGEEEHVSLPDELAISRIGLARYAEECLTAIIPAAVTERERIMAARLRFLTERHERILFVCGLGHYVNLKELLRRPPARGEDPRWVEAPVSSRILPLKEAQLGHVLREVPYTAYLYEHWRRTDSARGPFSPMDALREVLQGSAEEYEKEYDEKVNLTEWRALYQYGRNLSLVRGRLRPRLYELVTAAKGCVDDDFGAICLEKAVSYPPNKEVEPYDDGYGGDEDAGKHRSMNLFCNFGTGMERLQHAYPFPELGELEFRFRRRRPTLEEQEQWRERFGEEVWNGSGICSWPPEDIFIENFFRTIRQRAMIQISENHSSSEEFTSSVLDGLDVRETMRRWNEKKLYVRRERIPPGRIGPVVLVWRDLPFNVQPVWRACLYAENQNESDIAFYSQPLGKEMVGPGITRTEYFGILSVYPACHIPDVWLIPALRYWQTSARLLLAAALNLSRERFVAYVAERPPDLELRNYARDLKKAIVYLPLATFSKSLLKRARQCHILSGRQVRGWASDYIPEI
jgi:hypothetical protein